MKKYLLCVLVAMLGLPSLSYAANIADVSDEKIAELETLHAKAEDRVVENDFPGAIRLYQDILLIEPDDETAYTNLGRIYMITGDTQKAQECFRNALNINPENETALFGMEKIKDPDRGLIMDEEILEPVQTKTPVLPKKLTVPAPAVPAAVQIEPRPTPTLLSVREPVNPLPPFEKQVQIALKNAGLYTGEIDGKIGPASRNAIKKFQKFHGLKADGWVGPKTWAVLKPYFGVTGNSPKEN